MSHSDCRSYQAAAAGSCAGDVSVVSTGACGSSVDDEVATRIVSTGCTKSVGAAAVKPSSTLAANVGAGEIAGGEVVGAKPGSAISTDGSASCVVAAVPVNDARTATLALSVGLLTLMVGVVGRPFSSALTITDVADVGCAGIDRPGLVAFSASSSSAAALVLNRIST